MKKVLTFDDVALVPKYNDGLSRMDPDLETMLTKNVKIGIPITNSPMDTVIGLDLAEILWEGYGSVPIWHRFFPTVEMLEKVLDKWRDRPCFISCGAGPVRSTWELLEKYENICGVNIDLAHGHSRQMLDTIKEFKKRSPNTRIIAGAVCTPEAYETLVHAGADAVRVGIGCGSACTTRMVTGFGVSQFTAIYECANSYTHKHYRVPIISDGGIRDSRDLVLALAAGCDCVLLGKLLALTKESASPKTQKTQRPGADPILQALYRGQASREFQEDFYGKVKPGTAPEGEEFWAPVTGSAFDVINQLLGGVRSGLTYAGAKNIKELQAKAEFVEVTSSYRSESRSRPV